MQGSSGRGHSEKEAVQEAEATIAQIRDAVQARDFDVARRRLVALGMSRSQIKRRRVGKKPGTNSVIERPVFICGLHRSGTTLFHDYLAAHYQTAYFSQTKVPENEGQFLQNVYMSEQPFGGPGAFAFSRQMQFGPVRNKTRADLLGNKLLRQWGRWTQGDAKVLLEKSPPNIVRISYFRSLFPTAKFIVWTRDPRAVSLSTKKWHDLPVDTLMMHWNAAYMKAFDDLREDCIVTSYEKFCEDPAGVTAEIAAFCGLERRPEDQDMRDRFATITNRNGDYIKNFPTSFQIRNKVKAWEIFGYSL